jgi:hydroxymethylpyrimidine pyrophosphatase-like HAD family hydrolase
MILEALATDYDGTLAENGAVDAATIEALQRGRRAGLRTIMVTGRELHDLFNIFPHPALFDRIVVENGAVVYDPTTQAVEVLAAPPPPALVERLTRERIPISVGHSILATAAAHEPAVSGAIRDLALEWHVIFNKGSVMALPASITKATGLAFALAALGITPARTVGVGDAENDEAFLRACGVAVAVDNALAPLKAMAHVVTTGVAGAGVIELIDRMLGGELDPLVTVE